MSDCISRQEAIEALYHVDEYNGRSVEAIRKLPPAQPEPHWIPVTEATPIEEDDYWATFEADEGRFVDWASWYHGKWVVWLDSYPNEVTNVIAWQKCPEPYKEVTA